MIQINVTGVVDNFWSRAKTRIVADTVEGGQLWHQPLTVSVPENAKRGSQPIGRIWT